MGTLKQRMQNMKMPHTYVILTGILLLVAVLTYLIPAGEYARVLDPVSGREIVDPDSFHFVEGNRPGFFGIFLALQRGYVDAAGILFLIIFAYGYVYMLIDNGTLNALIGGLIRALGEKTFLIIPVGMAVFGILGSTMGIFEEVYGMVPVFAGIAAALGYDIIGGGSHRICGSGHRLCRGYPESLFYWNCPEHRGSSHVFRPFIPHCSLYYLSDSGGSLCHVVCPESKKEPQALRPLRRASGGPAIP